MYNKRTTANVEKDSEKYAEAGMSKLYKPYGHSKLSVEMKQ